MQVKSFSNAQLEQACQQQLFTLDRKISSASLKIEDIGDYIPGCVMVQDLATQTNLYMNKSGCDILGHNRHELAALGPEYYKRFFPEEEIAAIMPGVLHLMHAQDTDRVVGFYQRVRKSAAHEYKWYYTCSKLIAAPTGKTCTIINIANPVNSLGERIKGARAVIGGKEYTQNRHPRFARLTNREKEVLRHLALGRSAREIAEMLAISANTVHAHHSNICNKLQINTYAGLVEFAAQFDLN